MSPAEEPAEPGMRLHIQQAPRRLEEEEKGRITATRTGAPRNRNGFLMGFPTRMKRCTFRRLLRAAGELDTDHIHGQEVQGGRWVDPVDCQSSTQELDRQGNVNRNGNVSGQRHKVTAPAGLGR